MTDDEMLTVDGRSAVRLERRYPHPIEKVWRAVTEPEHLAAWFPASLEADLRVGGAVTCGFGADPDGGSGVGEVLELEPPRLFAFTWDDIVLRFELATEDAGTRFVLTHVFDDTAGAASFAAGWGACMAALGAALAGEAPASVGGLVARHEELVSRFGLDRAAVTEDDGRWTVRFERQLTCPAEVAWDLFLGVDRDTGEQRAAPALGEPLAPAGAPEGVLGTVTEVDRPGVLAFDAAPGEPGDHVRLDLGAGTGHGARLVLTVTGSTEVPDERPAVGDRWGGAVAEVAAGAAARAEAHVTA